MSANIMKAIYNNAVIAESDKTVLIEQNHYFPPDAVKMEYLKKSEETYVCPWKGQCTYYDVVVDGKTDKIAAFVYHEPKEAAKEIAGYIAFWKNVAVVQE